MPTSVAGTRPRIAPLDPAELTDEALAPLNDVRASLSLPPTDRVGSYAATMLRHPELYRRHMDLAAQLFRGVLSFRSRELVILTIAARHQAPFIWHEHTALAADAGLTEAEVERVRQGSAAAGWSDEDRAIIAATEELLSDAVISEPTWASLARTLQPAHLIELPILVGQYVGLAYLQRSIGLEPD